MTAERPVSGDQYLLDDGVHRATVASVGASLRVLQHDGRDLVIPYAEDEVRPTYRGLTLAPWPNRVVDGRYRFGGTDHQLALSEPDRSHALHGLAGALDYTAGRVSDSAVTLTATIEAQPGYPWRVRVETTYALGGGGLTQTVRGTNLSGTDAPWGTGPHPYLLAGPGTVDDWTMQVPADQVLTVTDDRLCPQALRPVDGSERFDFRRPRQVGIVEIDHAFTGLDRDGDGLATVRLTAADGAGVAISWGASCPWVQVHTADRPGGAGTPFHRAGMAVEPMTCAPDAFNDGRYEHETGLITLAPGEIAEASWTISAIVG